MIVEVAPKRLLLKAKEQEKVTESGIIISQAQAVKEPSKGILKQIGADCRIDSSYIGCEVVFKDFSKEALELEENGEKKTYWIIPEDDVLAYLR